MRCFISGMGIIHFLGIHKDDIRENIMKDQNIPVAPATDETGIFQKAFRLTQFDPQQIHKSRHIRRMDKFGKMAQSAAKLALQDAGIETGETAPDRIGCIYNTIFGPSKTTLGYIDVLYKLGPTQTSPAAFSNTVTNAAIGYISMDFNLKGPSSVICGTSSVAYGYNLIRNHQADIILCGGVEELSPDILKALVHNIPGYETKVLQDKAPYFGEGAAFVVLESEESLKRRNKHAYAEINGVYGYSDPESGVQLHKRNFSKATLENFFRNTSMKHEDIDAIIGCSNTCEEITRNEQELFSSFFHGGIPPIIQSKKLFGECLGISETLSVVTGCMLMNEPDFSGKFGITNPCSLLVHSFEIGGNIMYIGLNNTASPGA
jgi:3-oxoacyl-[acyl-carrier-protein] synthase II